MYNKIKIAQLQRIALKNFSSMCMNGNHYVNGSIPTGKTNESYVLETKKRKRLPGIKEYICSRLKSMKNEEYNTPEYYRERSKKYERNKLPELINIKNSGRFQFHIFHDQYGYKKELDKRGNPEPKMTKEKVRDLKIMSKINKLDDPELIDFASKNKFDGVFRTSAKTGSNINEAMSFLIETILDRMSKISSKEFMPDRKTVTLDPEKHENNDNFDHF